MTETVTDRHALPEYTEQQIEELCEAVAFDSEDKDMAVQIIRQLQGQVARYHQTFTSGPTEPDILEAGAVARMQGKGGY